MANAGLAAIVFSINPIFVMIFRTSSSMKRLREKSDYHYFESSRARHRREPRCDYRKW